MYWKRPGSMLETSWKCAGNVLEMSWKCTGNALEMCWKRVGNILEMWWKCAGNVLKMCGKRAGNVLETCWKYTGNALKIKYRNVIGWCAETWVTETNVLKCAEGQMYWNVLDTNIVALSSYKLSRFRKDLFACKSVAFILGTQINLLQSYRWFGDFFWGGPKDGPHAIYWGIV